MKIQFRAGPARRLASGGFDVREEAKRAVVAALARHELLGMSGAAWSSSIQSAEAAYGRTVERMAESAFMQADSAARAAGDRNPSRAAGVVIPWLLQNIDLVRRAGTMAASRVLQLRRQGIYEDSYAALGPAFVYEVLGGPGGTTLCEVFERPSHRHPTDTVQWQCDIPAGTLIEGWPLGPDVWVHLQAPAAHTHALQAARLSPPTIVEAADGYPGEPSPPGEDQPHAYVPLLHEGRQQLALVERATTCMVVDRRGSGDPYMEGHDVFGGDSDPCPSDRCSSDGDPSDAESEVGRSDDDGGAAAVEQLALTDLQDWRAEATELDDAAEEWGAEGQADPLDGDDDANGGDCDDAAYDY